MADLRVIQDTWGSSTCIEIPYTQESFFASTSKIKKEEEEDVAARNGTQGLKLRQRIHSASDEGIVSPL